MKITRVETMVVNLPMVIEGAPPRLRDRAVTSIDILLVRVDTDQGVSGWGESFGHRIFPATRAAIDTVLGPMCVGRDPTQISAIHDDLQRLLHGVGRNGPTIYALSGIDIALWDIAGKVAGLPLYRLLGGGARADLPAYASLLRYGKADAVAFYTEQALKRGYRDIKLHEITVPEVKAARDVAGTHARIMLDTNCPWTVVEAVEMARRLAPLGLRWLEEPVFPPENVAGLAEVRNKGGIPTAAGENYGTVWDFRRAFEAGAIDYAQPSVTKIGGVTELCRVTALAETFGVTVVPHSAYFGPRLLASIHCPSPGDGLALCGALALVTREIPFGTSIAHIYTRHVFEWAQTAAVIHELSGGRFRFGVGVSHGPAHARLGLNPGKPLDDVRRFVTELKGYAPQVGALPPITLATLRRKMVALAGEIAEGAVWANAARSHMAESLRHLPDARRNDPSFFVGNMLPTCIDPDRAAAAAVMRKALAPYVKLPNYQNYWIEAGYEREEIATMSDRWLGDVKIGRAHV